MLFSNSLCRFSSLKSRMFSRFRPKIKTRHTSVGGQEKALRPEVSAGASTKNLKLPRVREKSIDARGVQVFRFQMAIRGPPVRSGA